MTTTEIDVSELKRLSLNVVNQYEDLLEKFKDNEEKYQHLVEMYKEKEKQLQDMQKLIQPAVSEYEQIKMKYDMEVDMRSEAESFASQIVQENKNLKRQSAMLLSKIPENLDVTTLNLDEEETDSKRDSYKDYTNKLNTTIRELESKVATLTSSLKQTQEDLDIEKERSKRLHTEYTTTHVKLTMTENSLQQHKDAIQELSKVSEAAYIEFELLQEKYELANKRRSDVESKMTEIKIQNEAIKKQSTILLSNVASNMQLAMALNEVETLTTQLEEQKNKYDKEIEKIKQQLDDCSGKEALEELNLQNSQLKEEKESLSEKLTQYEEQYKSLETQYKELEGKYQDATRPPPPPPPPPPPSIQKSKGFLSNIKNKPKTEEQANKSAAPQGYSQALEEMMKRIQGGTPLLNKSKGPPRREENKDSTKAEPSDSAAAPPKATAMQELNGILGKFKRNMSVGDVNGVQTGKGVESELDKIFRRRNIGQDGDLPGAKPSSVSLMSKPPQPAVAPKPFKQKDLKAATLPPKIGNVNQLSIVEEERRSQVVQQDSTERDEVFDASSA